MTSFLPLQPVVEMGLFHSHQIYYGRFGSNLIVNSNIRQYF